MMPVFAFSMSPFSRTKFAAYLLGLAAVAGLPLTPAGPRAAEPFALKQDGPGAQGAVFDLLRFAKPSHEILEGLPTIGIPWFMRRAGVAGQASASDPSQLVITLAWDGKIVGRYIERVQPIDADRTRLYLAFEPADMALVRRLAAPIDSTLDPLSLLRVTLAEHIRSSMDGDGFRLSVLEPDAPRSKLTAIAGALRAESRRDSDIFPLSGPDSEEAAVRQAYRDEAERAGAAAPKL